ncbi:MAG: hypothetical protein ACRDOD_04705 [Streptosporangiaceae bacterium]
MDTLTARMPNPATIIPEAMKPIQALFESISGGGVPQATLDLVHLRVSQVNGCSRGRPPTTPRPNGPRWRSPRRSPGSATGPTRYLTRSGTPRLVTTTSGGSRR